MTIDRGLLGRIRARGEEVFTQLSGELMTNPRFMNAMESALRGKQRLEEAVGHVVRSMNVPTRSEFKRALARIETLERQVASRRAKVRPSNRRRAVARAKKPTPPR